MILSNFEELHHNWFIRLGDLRYEITRNTDYYFTVYVY